MAEKVERYEVFHIREATGQTEAKHFWDRCGVAFVNKDGSINVSLSMLPLDGKVQLRKPEPKAEKVGEAP